jgi:hypothetical protein
VLSGNVLEVNGSKGMRSRMRECVIRECALRECVLEVYRECTMCSERMCSKFREHLLGECVL